MNSQLPEIREALLNLHKTLVNSERTSYEQTMGTIPSPNHLLQLLTNDPWFAWLHHLSLLIVAMDQAIDAKRHPVTPAQIDALIRQARQLLTASETGEGFPRHYYEALQRDPEVVMAHADVARLFPPKKNEPSK